jgi:hypothetical protein
MNPHLLKIKVGPAQYTKIPFSDYQLIPAPEQYWEVVPRYLLARCPLCGGEYVAQLDTYSLKRWSRSYYGGTCVFDIRHQEINCGHFVLVHYFVSLNGQTPTEIRYFDNNSEVPYVVPRLLGDVDWPVIPQFEPEVLDPHAVMHALPICRIENRQFVPRYSLYTITYFALNPEPVNAYYYKLRDFQATFPTPLRRDADRDLWWDLAYWVERNKLWWLDASDQALPLRHFPESFPYGNIQGIRYGMTYRDGEGRKSGL